MVPFRLLACLVPFAAFAPAASAQGLFDAPWRSFQLGSPANGAFTLQMTSADLNGDGLPDAITAQNVYHGGLRVLLNLGSAQGSPATFENDGTLLPLSKGAWDLVAADLDGDGDIDLAAPNTDLDYSGSTVVVFRNNGNGTFAPGTSFPAGSAPYGIAAADLDGDADVDLVVTNYGWIGQGTSIHVLRNNGGATFAAPTPYTVQSGPARVRAGDLDGDGDADIVVSHDDTVASVLFNAGNGTFGPQVVYDYANSNYGAPGMALADPDGDGDLDVAFAGYYDQTANDGKLGLLRNNGSGVFTMQLVPYGAQYNDLAVELVATDLDGDGRTDLVGAQQYEPGFAVFRDNDTGSWRPVEMYASVQNVSGDTGATGIAAADLDQDGDPDVMTSGRITRLMSAHENVGGGIFPELPIQGRGVTHIVLDVGDMDGDGDLDTVTSHGGASTSDVLVYRNSGTGTFTQSHRVGGNYAFAKFAELTGDGVLDLLFVAAPTAPPYDFFTARGNGDGTFQPPVRHPINLCGIGHPSAFDLDHDGDLDVINTETAGCFGGGGNTIRVSLNNGNGTFAPQMIFNLGLWPYNVNAGDFNEDGNLDLVSASQGFAGMILGNGDGTFQQPGITLAAGELSANVLVLDLDGDTHLDVVGLRGYSPTGATGSESELVVMFGDGAGAFAAVAYPQFLTQDFREWLAQGDVDADGDVDILTGGVNDALVWLNDGQGALTFDGRYGIGASAFSMHYADLTGDGQGDLVALCSHELPPYGGEYGLVVVEGIGAQNTGSPFCFGDGSGTACPCGNSGVAGRGCANSLHAGGARLAANGQPSIANDTLVLAGSEMPNSSCLYFQGSGQVNGGAGIAFGDGLRCVGGSILRLGTKSNVGGASQYPTAGDPTISVRGLNNAGDVRHYQAWYRNAAPTFCTASTFNLTNGVSLTWTL